MGYFLRLRIKYPTENKQYCSSKTYIVQSLHQLVLRGGAVLMLHAHEHSVGVHLSSLFGLLLQHELFQRHEAEQVLRLILNVIKY